MADVFGSMPRLPGVSEADRESQISELQSQFIIVWGKRKPCPVLKDGEVIYSQPGELDSHQNTQLAFTVAFGEGEVLECEPVSESLRQLLDLVKGAVEPFRPLLS